MFDRVSKPLPLNKVETLENSDREENGQPR